MFQTQTPTHIANTSKRLSSLHHPCPLTALWIKLTLYSCSLNKCAAYLTLKREGLEECSIRRKGKTVNNSLKRSLGHISMWASYDCVTPTPSSPALLTHPVCQREASSFIGTFHVSQRTLWSGWYYWGVLRLIKFPSILQSLSHLHL